MVRREGIRALRTGVLVIGLSACTKQDLRAGLVDGLHDPGDEEQDDSKSGEDRDVLEVLPGEVIEHHPAQRDAACDGESHRYGPVDRASLPGGQQHRQEGEGNGEGQLVGGELGPEQPVGLLEMGVGLSPLIREGGVESIPGGLQLETLRFKIGRSVVCGLVGGFNSDKQAS